MVSLMTDEKPASPPARSGRFRPPFKATLAVLVAALALGAAAVPWWLSDCERLSRMVAKALPGFEGTVAIERARLGWVGPMVIEGISFAGPAEARPPVSISRVEVRHGLLGILLSAGDLGTVRVSGLDVAVAFDEDHHTNLEEIFPPPPTGPQPAQPVAQRSPIRMRLEVEKAIVRITAPWTLEPWVSDPISIRAALAPNATGTFSEWTLEPVELLADAQMDPAVSWGVLAYAAPVLADTTRSRGRFSLRLDGATLPVGDPAAGSLSGVLAMHEVVVGPGPLVTNLLQSLPVSLPRPPDILVADESRVRFQLADRKVRHEGLTFGLPLPGPGRRLDVESSGTVALDDRAVDLKLVLPIPTDLRQDRPLLAALAGKTISVGVAGNLDEPEVVFDGSIRQTAGEVAADLLERVRGGQPPPPEGPADRRGEAGGPSSPPAPRSGDQAGDSSTGEAIVDIVGDVLEEVARRRAERRAAEADGQAPPRRGRLRQRLLRPPPAPQPPP